MRSFDAIIMGAGQAGPALAGRLNDAGLSVAIIERHHVGGTCVNTGCRPTKTLVASAYEIHTARRGTGYGFSFAGAVGAAYANDRVDLGDREAAVAEIKLRPIDAQLLELERQFGLVPLGAFCNPAIGHREQAQLLFGQVREPNDRNGIETQLAGRSQPSMPADDVQFVVNNDRNVEAAAA